MPQLWYKGTYHTCLPITKEATNPTKHSYGWAQVSRRWVHFSPHSGTPPHLSEYLWWLTVLHLARNWTQGPLYWHFSPHSGRELLPTYRSTSECSTYHGTGHRGRRNDYLGEKVQGTFHWREIKAVSKHAEGSLEYLLDKYGDLFKEELDTIKSFQAELNVKLEKKP